MFLTVSFSWQSFKGLCLCYKHTQHLGFWNWFPPISGWFEQPWLVSHTPISTTSQQLRAGSLDWASHQAFRTAAGKRTIFLSYRWVRLPWMLQFRLLLRHLQIPAVICMRFGFHPWVCWSHWELCYQLPNECCAFNCQYRYPSFCGEWKYSAAEENPFTKGNKQKNIAIAREIINRQII